MFRGRFGEGRINLLLLTLAFVAIVIILSGVGILSPLEDIVATPLNWASGVLNRSGLSVSNTLEESRTYTELLEYTGELETALAGLTSEVVSLREIERDYQRLADLVNYTTTTDNQEVIAADVISRDTESALRTIVINRGGRDGIRVGMPVVTGQGLVGRVIEVSSAAARVMLITSEASAIAGRLQNSRSEGAVIGRASGELRMIMLDQDVEIVPGELVLTSGLGGNLPPDLVIGQVRSTRQFESEIEQTAEISSLVDFDSLEIVMVITSFEPVDLSIFEQEEETP